MNFRPTKALLQDPQLAIELLFWTLCQNLAIDPFTDTCQPRPHLFCQECINYLNRKKLPCPTSEQTSAILIHGPDIERSKQIAALQIHCKYKTDDCQWKGLLENYESHLETCPRNYRLQVSKRIDKIRLKNDPKEQNGPKWAFGDLWMFEIDSSDSEVLRLKEIRTWSAAKCSPSESNGKFLVKFQFVLEHIKFSKNKKKEIIKFSTLYVSPEIGYTPNSFETVYTPEWKKFADDEKIKDISFGYLEGKMSSVWVTTSHGDYSFNDRDYDHKEEISMPENSNFAGLKYSTAKLILAFNFSTMLTILKALMLKFYPKISSLILLKRESGLQLYQLLMPICKGWNKFRSNFSKERRKISKRFSG